MKENLYKYTLSITLIIQVLLITYLSTYFFSNDKVDKYSEIAITGNKFLPEEKYLSYLYQKLNENDLSLYAIKSILESHPYIFTADVKKGDNRINVEISEKKIYSTIIRNNEAYFISDTFELIKVLPSTINISMPLLITPYDNNSNYVVDGDIKVAFKLIDALKIINQELLSRLIEINLKDEKDIMLIFNHLNALVYLKKNNLVKEILTLSEFLNSYNSSINNNTKYIDLRFNNQVIVG